MSPPSPPPPHIDTHAHTHTHFEFSLGLLIRNRQISHCKINIHSGNYIK